MIASHIREEKVSVEVKEEVSKKVFGPFLNVRRENPFIRNRRKNVNGCNLRKKEPGDLNCKYASFSKQGTDRQAGD